SSARRATPAGSRSASPASCAIAPTRPPTRPTPSTPCARSRSRVASSLNKYLFRLGRQLGLVLGRRGRHRLEVVLHQRRPRGARARLGVERRLRLALEVRRDVA